MDGLCVWPLLGSWDIVVAPALRKLFDIVRAYWREM